MKLIKNLLKRDFLIKKSNENEIDEKTLFFIFQKIIKKEFGDIGAEHFLPQHFSKKTIFIKANSSAWASELWLNQKRIVGKINKEIGKDILDTIKIK